MTMNIHKVPKQDIYKIYRIYIASKHIAAISGNDICCFGLHSTRILRLWAWLTVIIDTKFVYKSLFNIDTKFVLQNLFNEHKSLWCDFWCQPLAVEEILVCSGLKSMKEKRNKSTLGRNLWTKYSHLFSGDRNLLQTQIYENSQTKNLRNLSEIILNFSLSFSSSHQKLAFALSLKEPQPRGQHSAEFLGGNVL